MGRCVSSVGMEGEGPGPLFRKSHQPVQLPLSSRCPPHPASPALPVGGGGGGGGSVGEACARDHGVKNKLKKNSLRCSSWVQGRLLSPPRQAGRASPGGKMSKSAKEKEGRSLQSLPPRGWGWWKVTAPPCAPPSPACLNFPKKVLFGGGILPDPLQCHKNQREGCGKKSV